MYEHSIFSDIFAMNYYESLRMMAAAESVMVTYFGYSTTAKNKQCTMKIKEELLQFSTASCAIKV